MNAGQIWCGWWCVHANVLAAMCLQHAGTEFPQLFLERDGIYAEFSRGADGQKCLELLRVSGVCVRACLTDPLPAVHLSAALLQTLQLVQALWLPSLQAIPPAPARWPTTPLEPSLLRPAPCLGYAYRRYNWEMAPASRVEGNSWILLVHSLLFTAAMPVHQEEWSVKRSSVQMGA